MTDIIKVLRIHSYQIVLFLFLSLTSLSKISNFSPYTEGWWSMYAQMVSKGLTPYRDFELLTPPGFVYITQFFEKLVGANFLALRFVGSFVQVSIGILIFMILARRTHQLTALMITAFANVYLYSGVASITFDYNYFAVLMLLLGFNFIDVLKHNGRKFSLFLSVLAGLCFGLSFMIKQSFAITTFIFLVTTLFVGFIQTRDANRQLRLKIIGGFTLGFLFPIFSYLAYAINGNFNDELFRDIFQSSLNAKGESYTVLFGWIINTNKYFSLKRELIFVIFLVLLFAGVNFLLKRLLRAGWTTTIVLRFTSSIFFVLAILVSLASIASLIFTFPLGSIDTVSRKSLLVIFSYTQFVLPLFFGVGWIFLLIKKTNSNLTLLFALNSGLLVGCGLSGGIDQFGKFLAIPTLVMIILNLSQIRFIHAFVALTLSLFIAGFNSFWLSNPYAWWGYKTSSASEATITSDYPFTGGLKTDHESKEAYDAIVKGIKKNKKCEKVMLTYSNMTSFALDTGYRPYENQVQYWYDFTSSRRVYEVIKNLQKNPPPVILYTQYPDSVSYFHALLFNGSKVYAQEQLQQTLDSLITNDYNSLTRDLPFSEGYKIKLAVRKNCAA